MNDGKWKTVPYTYIYILSKYYNMPNSCNNPVTETNEKKETEKEKK